MVLLLDLDVCQQLAEAALSKIEDIRVVLTGDQLFRTDTVCRKKRIVLLVLRICHTGISCLGLIVLSVGIVAVTGRHRALQHLAQRFIVLPLLALQGLEKAL